VKNLFQCTVLYLHNLEIFRSSNKKIKSTRILILIIVTASTTATDANSQDPQFSQFFANPLYLNPAFAGTNQCPRMCMNYRNEWPALSGTFVTSSASYDQYVKALEGGIGFVVLSDQAGGGTLNTMSANVLYAYHGELNRYYSIRAGFQAGYIQKHLDWNKLTFGDMIDPRYGFIYDTKETAIRNSQGNLDLSTGLLIYSKKVFGGFALHHLTQPSEGFIDHEKTRLPLKLTVHAGAVIPLDETDELRFSPNIIFQRQQDFQQLILGFYLKRGPIYGGLWYRQAERNPDSFIIMTGIQMGKVRFGYSYDITLSKLSNYSGGSHELSITAQFPCPKKSPYKRPQDCPSW